MDEGFERVQQILCCHDYPTYIDSEGYIRCDGCDRPMGVNA